MKITALKDALSFAKRDSRQGREDRKNDQTGSDGSREESGNETGHEKTYQVTEDSVQSAIESFRDDADTQASGLSASKVGKGPGLRIVLKDVGGSVIRQFTGEEFLKLREAVSKGGRGKIIDQKF